MTSPSPAASSLKPALFLDRDGTLMPDVGYPRLESQLSLYPDVSNVLRRMQESGYLLFIITNQSGVARGFLSLDRAQALNRHTETLLAAEGVHITRSYLCPHGPADDCLCRKPKPGMLLRAAEEFSIQLERSFMLGDKESDILAGRAAGCRSIRIAPTGTASSADWVAPDVSSACQWIEGLAQHTPQR